MSKLVAARAAAAVVTKRLYGASASRGLRSNELQRRDEAAAAYDRDVGDARQSTNTYE